MVKKLFFMILFVILLSTSMAVGQSLPCVVSQVDRASFGAWEKIVVWSAGGNENCAFYSMKEMKALKVPLNFVLARLEPDGRTTQVGEQVRGLFTPDPQTRVETAFFDAQKLGLVNGRYMVVVANVSEDGSAWNFLQAIHFVIGAETWQSNYPLPYVQPAAIVSGGHLYFHGTLGDWTRADGYLYQSRKGRTEIIPAQFRGVDPQNQTMLVNRPDIRSGPLDLPWVQVKLPNNSFDPNQPVYASLTVSGGAVTVTVMVYDPSNPSRYYEGGFDGTPRGR